MELESKAMNIVGEAPSVDEGASVVLKCIEESRNTSTKKKSDKGKKIKFSSAIKRFEAIDSLCLIDFILQILPCLKHLRISRLSPIEKRMLQMFYATIWCEGASRGTARLLSARLRRMAKDTKTIQKLTKLLKKKRETVLAHSFVDLGFECPLEIHSSYTRTQVLVALDHLNPKTACQRTRFLAKRKIHVIFVTLDEQPGSSALDKRLFLWQSSKRTSETSTVGQKYIHHRKQKCQVLLFVRQFKVDPLTKKQCAYTFLGKGTYLQHKGSKPMKVVWKLDNSIPDRFIKKTERSGTNQRVVRQRPSGVSELLRELRMAQRIKPQKPVITDIESVSWESFEKGAGKRQRSPLDEERRRRSTPFQMKIFDAIEEDFVGNYIFDEDGLSCLFDEAETLLRSRLVLTKPRFTFMENDLLFVAMVNAVKNWNAADENTFWATIIRKLLGDENESRLQTFRGYLVEVVKHVEHKVVSFAEGHSAKRYYMTIMLHAFSPRASIESFLDLCWMVYSQDLDYEYRVHDDICITVANQLRHMLVARKSDSNGLNFGSSAYFIRAGLMRMAIDMPERMAVFVDRTLGLIDKSYRGILGEEGRADDYYTSLVRDWWAKKSDRFGGVRARCITENSSRIITDHAAIRAQYVYDEVEDSVCLLIPRIRLKDNFNRFPQITITRHGACVYQEPLRTFGSGLVMTTEELSLPLGKFVEVGAQEIDLSVQITHAENTLYDSGETLRREFIILGARREIQASECSPGSYLLFTCDKAVFGQRPAVMRQKDAFTYYISAEENESLQGRKKMVFFVTENEKHDIYFVSKTKSNVKYTLSGEEFNVVEGDVSIIVNTNDNISDYGVRYGQGKEMRLVKYPYETLNDRFKFKVTSLLEVGVPTEVIIFRYSDESRVTACKIVKFDRFEMRFDRPIYFDMQSSGRLELAYEGNEVISTEFDIKEEPIAIPFGGGDFIVKPPVLRWRIDDQAWRQTSIDAIWYRTLTNSSLLSLEMPISVGNYEVSLCTKAWDNDVQLPSRSTVGVYDLGAMIYAKANGFQGYYMSLQVRLLEAQESIVINLCDIYTKETFISSPVRVSDGMILWDPTSYIGDDNSSFTLMVLAEDSSRRQIPVFTSKAYLSLVPDSIPLVDVEKGFYTVIVDLVNEGLFARTSSTRLWSALVVNGDPNELRFHKKNIKLIGAYTMDMRRKIGRYDVFHRDLYIDQIQYIGINQHGDPCWKGRLVKYEWGRKIPFTKMPDGRGGMDEVNPVLIEWRTKEKCFIQAGFDIKSIAPKFEYETQFMFHAEGFLCNTECGTRLIEYYIYDVEEESRNV